jgi:flagellar hook assembly protein FlgD
VAFSQQQNLEFCFQNLKNQSAEIAIYNLKGQKVHSYKLLDGDSYRWNGKDHIGQRSAAGIYFIKVQVQGESPITRKLIIL